MLPDRAQLILSISISEFELSHLKPDFLLLDKTAKNALVIDVTLPFDTPQDLIESARSFKLMKYSTLVYELKRLGYDRVTVDAFVVKSLGSWDLSNAKVLSAVRLSRCTGKLIAKLAVSEAIA